MTDKQIIIDGVDVSGCTCRYYAYNRHLCSIIGDDLCEEHSDCLYKQLKRKEQECEELKAGYAELTEIVSPYMDDFTGYNEELGGFDIVLCVKQLFEQLDQLKAENRELKAVHSTNVALSDELFKYKAENEELREKYLELKEKEGNLVVQLNTITEAREQSKQNNKALEKENLDLISTEVKLRQTLAEIRDIATCCIEGDVARIRMKQILQKISECEVTNG